MGYISKVPEEFVSESTYNEWMTRGLPKTGDILFTTEAPLRNVAVLRLDEKLALAQRTLNLRPFGQINSEYVSYCIQSSPFQELLRRHATGMTATGIKSAKMKLLPFPIPSRDEQERIVKTVDTLMSLCDKLQAALTHAEEASEELVDAVAEEVVGMWK